MSEAPEAVPGPPADPLPGVAEPLPDAPDDYTEAQVQGAFADLDTDAPVVGIVMSSPAHKAAMDPAARELEQRGILHEVRVMCAHSEPDTVSDYARNAQMRGLKVIIAGASLSAALPGMIAAHSELPVIGVPLSSPQAIGGGLDALLSVAQMTPGVPVACVGVDAAHNAAVLAVRILGA